jgi:hypothetical protein
VVIVLVLVAYALALRRYHQYMSGRKVGARADAAVHPLPDVINNAQHGHYLTPKFIQA